MESKLSNTGLQQVSTSFLGLFGTDVGLLVESGRLFGDSRSNLNRPCGVSGSKLNQPRRSLSSLKLAKIILSQKKRREDSFRGKKKSYLMDSV